MKINDLRFDWRADFGYFEISLEGRMAHKNLLATIEAVRNSNRDRWKEALYQNEQGVLGWHFAFPYAELWHFISIHNYDAAPPRPESIANAIEGIEDIPDEKWGVFGNKKGSRLGYYATARSTRVLGGSVDHWFMIGRSWKKKIESAEREIRSLLLEKCFRKPEEEDLLQYLSSKTGQSLSDRNPFPPRGHRLESMAKIGAMRARCQF